jgi:DNA-binding FadR family transcriptional regulator
VAEFRERSRSGGDIRQELVANDTSFHEHILRASGNGMIRNTFGQTQCHLHVFRLYPADVDDTLTIEEHGQSGTPSATGIGPGRGREVPGPDHVYRRFA